MWGNFMRDYDREEANGYQERGQNDVESRSTLISRNITVSGRRTSVRLEPEMWAALRDIARRECCKIHDICTLIDMRKNSRTSLTAAIRVFLMLYYRASSTEEGHSRAGHGNFKNMMERARLNPEQVGWDLRRVAKIQPERVPQDQRLGEFPGIA